VLPPPTLVYLQVRSGFILHHEQFLMALVQRGQSISKTVVNFLTAMAAVNDGVREILPFIRYISQFIEFEFGTILAQDVGLGVVCAATW
jgi:sorbitol-specific phosphotransferase system component IIBC